MQSPRGPPPLVEDGQSHPLPLCQQLLARQADHVSDVADRCTQIHPPLVEVTQGCVLHETSVQGPLVADGP